MAVSVSRDARIVSLNNASNNNISHNTYNSSSFLSKSSVLSSSEKSSSKNKRKSERKKSFISRTLAIEQAYVHDVYSIIATDPDFQTISPVRSFVKQFLFDFEPGSIVLDVGCSDGQYLNLCPNVVVLGLEHCSQWFQNQNYKLSTDLKYLLLANVLYLPFRDDFFDGIICCSVLHHLSTLERRVKALKEIARIMKIGGRILLTVTSGGSKAFKDIQSQDVLFKVDNFRKSYHPPIGTELEYQNYAPRKNSQNELSSCDTFNSPSELENCYSFFKKAIKRFSLSSSTIHPFRNNFEHTTNAPSNIKIHNVDDYPIELLHIEEDKISCPSSKSSSTDADSALSSFNRSSGCISQTSSNNTMFPSSILSAIKGHLISLKTQFQNSLEQWQSFEMTDSVDKNSLYAPKNDQQTYHRFSLPIGFWRINKQDQTGNDDIFKLAKNKIYSSNNFEQKTRLSCDTHNKPETHHHRADLHVKEPIKHYSNEPYNIFYPEITKYQMDFDEPIVSGSNNSKTSNSGKILLQKSLSSESSSKQSSVHCSRYKLLAYYSMPELNTLFKLTEKDFHCLLNEQQNQKNYDLIIKKSSAHLTNFSVSSNSSLKECSEQNEEISERPNSTDTLEIIQNDQQQRANSTSPVNSKNLPDSETETESIVTELPSNNANSNPIQKPKAIDVSKFCKKLLRQRSFSADYQPETVKLQPDPPRRFSASPNIETHRYNKADHIPHNQQISIDSEESFVTIIPANRSTRESINNSDILVDFEMEEDECTNNQIISPNEIYSCSSEEEEACCESFENDQNTSNDTSISSVLEATIKSISPSDSMDSHDGITTISSMEEISRDETSAMSAPPGTLHQYYHLFRCGELEQIIDEHVQNLHVIDSFYSEYAMSWCVVAEKIHVWTI